MILPFLLFSGGGSHVIKREVDEVAVARTWDGGASGAVVCCLLFVVVVVVVVVVFRHSV